MQRRAPVRAGVLVNGHRRAGGTSGASGTIELLAAHQRERHIDPASAATSPENGPAAIDDAPGRRITPRGVATARQPPALPA